MGRCTAICIVINVSNPDLSYDWFDNLTFLYEKEQTSDIGKVILLSFYKSTTYSDLKYRSFSGSHFVPCGVLMKRKIFQGVAVDLATSLRSSDDEHHWLWKRDIQLYHKFYIFTRYSIYIYSWQLRWRCFNDLSGFIELARCIYRYGCLLLM